MFAPQCVDENPNRSKQCKQNVWAADPCDHGIIWPISGAGGNMESCVAENRPNYLIATRLFLHDSDHS